MSGVRRFAIALGAGVAVMAALGVAVALAYHPVRPRVLCAMPLGTGEVAVYFGYANETDQPVVEPVGPSNHVAPAGSPVTTFAPGASGDYPDAAFVVKAKAGDEVAWTLGPRTVRLDEDTQRCPIPPSETPPEDLVWVQPQIEPPAPPPPPPPPKIEPPPKVEPPPEVKPPPAIQPKVVKREALVKELVAQKPIALQLTALGKVDSGGMAIVEGTADVLGSPDVDDKSGIESVSGPGAAGGVQGGLAQVAPAAPPKRTAAKVTVRPKGEWPADAPPRAGSVVVRLSLFVGVDGKVKQVRVIHGAGPAFDREARAVGMRAEFKPATVDDQPVESWVPWDVEFSPDD